MCGAGLRVSLKIYGFESTVPFKGGVERNPTTHKRAFNARRGGSYNLIGSTCDDSPITRTGVHYTNTVNLMGESTCTASPTGVIHLERFDQSSGCPMVKGVAPVAGDVHEVAPAPIVVAHAQKNKVQI